MVTTTGKRIRLLTLLFALVLGGFLVAPDGVRAEVDGIPSVGTNFHVDGPFAVTVTNGPNHTYFHPTTMSDGNDHPVILWGNGTGVTPTVYSGLLRHFASHGFIVAAANTTNAGSGAEMLQGLDELTRLNNLASSPFYAAVDLTRVGTSGHSQGGGGAIQAAADPRVDTTFPLQPFLGDPTAIRGSAFFLSGQNDTTIPPATVLSKYEQATAAGKPALYGELAGANHFIPAGAGGGYRYAVTAWARFELMDDDDAKVVLFGDDCILCNSPEWSDYRVNALAQRAPK